MQCDDHPKEESAEPLPRQGWHEEADPVDVARDCLAAAYQRSLLIFEEQIATWLAEDPEHLPVLRLVLLAP